MTSVEEKKEMTEKISEETSEKTVSEETQGITLNDIVILISLSGESEELKNIIQYTSRNKNIKLIGVTSKKDSVLYKNSDIKLLIPIVKEAGPGNFVPTSSTIVQLALGDAIAIACMKNKKFDKKTN